PKTQNMRTASRLHPVRSDKHRLCLRPFLSCFLSFESSFLHCPFLPRLAGTASWETFLRAQRHGGLLPWASPPLGVYGSPKNQHDEIFGTPSKSSPWPREQGPTRLWVRPPDGQKGRQHDRRNENSKDRNKYKTDGLVGRALE